MVSHKSRVGSLLVAVACVTIASIRTFAATPAPPPLICIGSSCLSSTAASSSRISWNPGHYVEHDQVLDNDTSRSTLSSKLDLPSAWKGVCAFTKWGHLEGDTPGDYSRADAHMTWLLNNAQSKGKKIILIFDDKRYGGYAPLDLINGLFLPKYLRTNSQYANPADPNGGNGIYEFSPTATGNLSVMARTWTPQVMDRAIALVSYLGTKWGAHPALEGIYYSSVSIGGSSTQTAENGYNVDAHLTQVKRWAVAARTAFPTKNVGIMMDWTGTYKRALDMVAWGRPYNIAWSNYDTVDWKDRPGRVTPGQGEGESHGDGALRGAAINGGGINGNTPSGVAGVDMRGKTAFSPHVQSPDWDRSPHRYGVNSIEEFSDIHSLYKATHVCWTQYDWAATTSGFNPANVSNPWRNIIRPYVERNPTVGISTTYPTDWPQ